MSEPRTIIVKQGQKGVYVDTTEGPVTVVLPQPTLGAEPVHIEKVGDHEMRLSSGSVWRGLTPDKP